MTEENIVEFWRWFIKNETRIKGCISNKDITEQEKIVKSLNEYILGFGPFSWDIGLNENDDWFLTISPNLDPELLKISKAIIDLAPTHLDWKFYSSKPCKKWNYQLEVYDELMDIFKVDSSAWNFVALEEEDGTIELNFELFNLSQRHDEAIENAITAFIINELGEEVLTTQISNIEIFEQFDAELNGMKCPVTMMKSELIG
ncbi:MAG: hypothetical protein MK105_06065 [Crocinitomicaceae bacterium]|nr:hypothetical protein [Crocinitomicaceae bacterium]